jgi:hypothetical protein
MAGKPSVRGSARVFYVLDKLSKTFLADIVLDLIQAEIGDGASDEAIFERLQPVVDTLARLRGEGPKDLAGLARRGDAYEARYLERERQRKESLASTIETQNRLSEKIKEINRENDKLPYTHPDLRQG